MTEGWGWGDRNKTVPISCRVEQAAPSGQSILSRGLRSLALPCSFLPHLPWETGSCSPWACCSSLHHQACFTRDPPITLHTLPHTGILPCPWLISIRKRAPLCPLCSLGSPPGPSLWPEVLSEVHPGPIQSEHSLRKCGFQPCLPAAALHSLSTRGVTLFLRDPSTHPALTH